MLLLLLWLLRLPWLLRLFLFLLLSYSPAVREKKGVVSLLAVQEATVYYGESRILRHVDLEVPAGEVRCLMGRNGVGKTTLLSCIMGVIRPRVGQILLNAVDVTALPPHSRARAGIGYVPQGRGIFPHLTVYENVLVGLEATRHKDLPYVDHVLGLFPRLKGMLSRAAGALSGGEQQQLALARALVGRPRLLLLDEPTEGIQPSIVLEIEDLIQSIRQERRTSILLVEQYLDFALRVSDYYYVMEKGSIVSEGAVHEITAEVIQEHLAI